MTYLCSVVGVYSSAVDAQQCIRALRRVGCVGATVCEAKLNAETTLDNRGTLLGSYPMRQFSPPSHRSLELCVLVLR